MPWFTPRCSLILSFPSLHPDPHSFSLLLHKHLFYVMCNINNGYACFLGAYIVLCGLENMCFLIYINCIHKCCYLTFSTLKHYIKSKLNSVLLLWACLDFSCNCSQRVHGVHLRSQEGNCAWFIILRSKCTFMSCYFLNKGDHDELCGYMCL